MPTLRFMLPVILVTILDMFQKCPHIDQGDEVRGSNEQCLLTSNFDAKIINEVKQSKPLIVIFYALSSSNLIKTKTLFKSPTFRQRFTGFLIL